jgi:hypothetical protein
VGYLELCYLGEKVFLLFSCGTTGQANYYCERCVLDFILLLWDTCKQTNTSKIKKSLLLTLNSSKKMFNIHG